MNRPKLRNVEMMITTMCTLKCKLCGNLAPYAQSKEHIPIEEVCDDVDAFFQFCDSIERIQPVGGEPLIYPWLVECVTKLLQYVDRIGCIRLVTNCTVLPDPELLKLAEDVNKQHTGKIEFLLSNYGSLSKQFSNIKRMLEEREIPFRIDNYTGEDQYYGGFVNLGILENREPHNPEVTKNIFENCGCATSVYTMLYKGKIYPCTTWVARVIAGLPPLDAEVVDLYSDSSIDEKAAILAQYESGVPYASCHYCNGIGPHSKRYPGAEQL